MKNKILDNLVDVALVVGICFLSYNGKDGWGWLLFILAVRS